MQDSIRIQSEESSSNDSFCLQVHLQSTQVEAKIPASQHLITNLPYKLKPHKKTQYLRARLDICVDINIMPVSKDPDCKKLASSGKLEIGTYTTDMIKVIESYTFLAVHPDSQSLKEVTFHATSHKGSVVLSCVTTLELSLIQPLCNLDFIPSSASLISNKADYPRKNKFQKKNPSKSSQGVCSSNGQSHSVSTSEEYNVNQCVIQEDKDKTSKQECTAYERTVNLLCVMTRTINVHICGQ